MLGFKFVESSSPSLHWLFSTCTAKYYRLCEDYKNEKKSLLSSLSVLVCQNTFSPPDLSIEFIKGLVDNNVKGDAFGIEHASILYNISRFSLRCIYNKDSRYYKSFFIFFLFLNKWPPIWLLSINTSDAVGPESWKEMVMLFH